MTRVQALPTAGATLSRPVTGTLSDVLGRPVRELRQAFAVGTTGFAPGLYVVRAQDGVTD